MGAGCLGRGVEWRHLRGRQILIEHVGATVRRAVELLNTAGLADGAAWLAEWERVWSGNLESCDAAGQCRIQVS